jgi:hypothetical protein
LTFSHDFDDNGPVMAEYSNYQKKVIQRFYDNRESTDQQALAELVGNLYLTQGKKQARLWEQAAAILTRLNVPPKRAEHVLQSKDPTLLAEIVKDLESGVLQPGRKA